MREYQHIVTAADGARLSVRECVSNNGVVQRNLLLLHGVSEHGGRYAEFATAATTAGWRVLIPDHRGHGRSAGVRVHINHFDQYVDDASLHCRHFSLDPRHTAVLGHSMGALIAARLLEGDNLLASAACLLSPYLGSQVQIDGFTLLLGKILSVVWPTYHFRSRIKAAQLSVDEEYLKRRREDQLIERAVTAGWFYAAQDALREVHANVTRVQTPLLIVQGDDDQVVDLAATQAWFEAVSASDRTLEILPGRRHELLQEPDRAQTTKLILDWLNARLPRA